MRWWCLLQEISQLHDLICEMIFQNYIEHNPEIDCYSSHSCDCYFVEHWLGLKITKFFYAAVNLDFYLSYKCFYSPVFLVMTRAATTAPPKAVTSYPFKLIHEHNLTLNMILWLLFCWSLVCVLCKINRSFKWHDLKWEIIC